MPAPTVAASSATITPLFSAFCVGLCEKGKILLTEVILCLQNEVLDIYYKRNSLWANKTPTTRKAQQNILLA
jgi:hypothetical protein